MSLICLWCQCVFGILLSILLIRSKGPPLHPTCPSCPMVEPSMFNLIYLDGISLLNFSNSWVNILDIFSVYHSKVSDVNVSRKKIKNKTFILFQIKQMVKVKIIFFSISFVWVSSFLQVELRQVKILMENKFIKLCEKSISTVIIISQEHGCMIWKQHYLYDIASANGHAQLPMWCGCITTLSDPQCALSGPAGLSLCMHARITWPFGFIPRVISFFSLPQWLPTKTNTTTNKQWKNHTFMKRTVQIWPKCLS